MRFEVMTDVGEIVLARELLRAEGNYIQSDELRSRAWVESRAWIIDGVSEWDYLGSPITQTWSFPVCWQTLDDVPFMALTSRPPRRGESYEDHQAKKHAIKCRYCQHSYLRYCIYGIRAYPS